MKALPTLVPVFALAMALTRAYADPAPAGTDGKAASPAATPAPYGTKTSEYFLRRLAEAFIAQGASPVSPAPTPTPAPSTDKDTTAATAAPVRRIGPPPFDSPPYPDGDWQLGGGPNVIGDPGALRDSPYPLMQALYDGPNGDLWYKSRIQLYGWATVSGNLSTSHNTGPSQVDNYPEVYDARGNRGENDQDVLYFERMADESQTDHIDWGFRAAFLYGQDYRYMASRGYINDKNLFVSNKFSGFDTPMLYANLYIPSIAQGMNIIVGRIISLPDIEQQLSPNNLMASHSLVYSFDNYTMWGIWTSTKLNANWLLQVGLASGVDTAPWAGNLHDPGCQPTGSVMVQYIGSGGHDSFYVGMNSFNKGNFGFNNLQECIESYTHKFNERWWTTFEGQYMWTNGCTTQPTADVPIEDGYYPVRNGRAEAYGLLNYTCCRLAGNTFLTIRNEFWNDPEGYRSGYASPYIEDSVGITWWPDKLLCIRPEIRFDHCFKKNGLASSSSPANTTGDVTTLDGAFDNGARQSQVTFAVDATIHF